jgi:hypothetical protein
VSSGTASTRRPGCASDLDLDEMLAGDLAGSVKEARVKAHLATCQRCRDRLASFAAVEPPPFSYAHADRRIERPVVARRRWRSAAVVATLACAAAGLVLAVRLGGRAADPAGERTKGALGLTLMVRRANGVVENIVGEGRLAGGDGIRFSVAASKPGYVVVLGLDAAPSVTVYVPTAPESSPVRVDAAGIASLPGSIVADQTAGFERIVALECELGPGAPAVDVLKHRGELALARAHGQPERVTSLDSGCSEASVLVRKDVGAP